MRLCGSISRKPIFSGSSETVRGKETLDFFLSFMNQNRTKKDFYLWLTGFTEGDGSCFVSARGELGFEIRQDLTSVETMLVSESQHGFGRVSLRQTELTLSNGNPGRRHDAVFSISSKSDFERLSQIFKTRFLTVPKQNVLLSWMRKLKPKSKAYLMVPKLDLSFNNAWLSGFIDAEGSVYARFRSCKT